MSVIAGEPYNPFEPIGEVSRRQMVIDAIAKRHHDDVLTYDELAELLGVDDRQTVQGAVNDAKSGAEKGHNKALVVMPNIGYRIVLASEQLHLAQHHQQKSRRQLRKSHSKVLHVDMAKLTEGERAAVTLAATSIALQLDYQRRNDIRHARNEAIQQAMVDQQERSETELTNLRDRVARLERRDGGNVP